MGGAPAPNPPSVGSPPPSPRFSPGTLAGGAGGAIGSLRYAGDLERHQVRRRSAYLSPAPASKTTAKSAARCRGARTDTQRDGRTAAKTAKPRRRHPRLTAPRRIARQRRRSQAHRREQRAVIHRLQIQPQLANPLREARQLQLVALRHLHPRIAHARRGVAAHLTVEFGILQVVLLHPLDPLCLAQRNRRGIDELIRLAVEAIYLLGLHL